jgi:hypothetical protein
MKVWRTVLKVEHWECPAGDHIPKLNNLLSTHFQERIEVIGDVGIAHEYSVNNSGGRMKDCRVIEEDRQWRFEQAGGI